MTVVSGKTYRLRLSSMSSLASPSFQIQGHAMSVVEKDGHNVEPFTVQNLYIFCGETYSVLIKADQDSSRSYWMTTDVVDLLNTRNTVEGYFRWSVNNVSLNLPRTPYLIAMKLKLTKEFSQVQPPDQRHQANINGTTSNAVYHLPFNKMVDIVFQNANGLFPNSSDTHPWHLHGHDFGPGDDEHGACPSLRLDRAAVPYGEPEGVAVPFPNRAPFLHGVGRLGLVLEYGIDRVGRLPASIMGCGATKGK